ncbi:MAG TPA: hypothetical protein VM370_08725 [Candidatus Thermoplasmatota archaeon]|nr:hypothetical protein [Candidatus Thermoplasmatota archaeon]
MTAKAWFVLAWLAVLPLAAATYGEGSALEVAAPATTDGQADTLLPAGVASFVSPSASTPILVHLNADGAQVVLRTYDPSCGFPTTIPGAPPGACGGQGQARDEEVVLSDVSLAVVKPLSAYKLVVSTDRQYADSPSFGAGGDLVVTTSGTTTLGTNDAPQYLSGSDTGWNSDTSNKPFQPIYTADADGAQFGASGAIFRAVDSFEVFLQGVQITVLGTDPDGSDYSQTFDTRVPSDANAPMKVLVVEVNGGDLQATSSAPFTGFAPADQHPITDVHTRAKFDGATGTVHKDGDTIDHTSEAVSLAGPLSLQLTRAGDGRLAYTIVDGLQLSALAQPPADDDKPIPPAALAAAGAAGAGGAGALVALLYFWPRLKYAWTLALLPMYTRIERDAVLEHEKRDELYELIRVTPGIHAHEIGEKARIGWGTTVYHLKLLENHGLIVSKKSGRYKRFFVNTGEYTKKKDVYGALRNETAKGVADYIVNHPGTTQKEMCAALGIQPSLASWHVEKLEGVELVKRVKDGRMVRYFAGPAWSELNVRIDPLGGGAGSPAET